MDMGDGDGGADDDGDAHVHYGYSRVRVIPMIPQNHSCRMGNHFERDKLGLD
jgi:hypothetical protein